MSRNEPKKVPTCGFDGAMTDRARSNADGAASNGHAGETVMHATAASRRRGTGFHRGAGGEGDLGRTIKRYTSTSPNLAESAGRLSTWLEVGRATSAVSLGALLKPCGEGYAPVLGGDEGLGYCGDGGDLVGRPTKGTLAARAAERKARCAQRGVFVGSRGATFQSNVRLRRRSFRLKQKFDGSRDRATGRDAERRRRLAVDQAVERV